MKLTSAQSRSLQWLADHGGTAQFIGGRMVVGEEQTNSLAAQPVLHLVLKGAVECKNGLLVITDYGRRLVSPFKK